MNVFVPVELLVAVNVQVADAVGVLLDVGVGEEVGLSVGVMVKEFVGVGVGGMIGTIAMAMIVALSTDAVSSNSRVPDVTVTA